jgi:hypothetical protein
MKVVNKQSAIKPQDVVVAIKLRLLDGMPFTYASLAASLEMSASEVHASLNRAQMARLVMPSDEGSLEVNRSSLVEFIIYGVKYAFPAVLGASSRGVLTAYGAEPLRSALVHAEDAPVWPYAKGQDRGPALYPLYPSVPAVAMRDADLYVIFSLIDGLRIGAARERELASRLISERLL